MQLGYQIQRTPRAFLEIGRAGFLSYDGSLDRPGRIELYDPEFSDVQEFRHMKWTLTEINSNIHARYGSSVRLVGGNLSDGSIRFSDGKLVVEGKFLSALVIGGSLMTGYANIRQAIPVIYNDIHHVVRLAVEQLGMVDIGIEFRDERGVARDLLPYLPLDIRREEDFEDEHHTRIRWS